jgi:peptidoglycan/LPS O-acetylase OafA/YrhL
MIVSLRRTMSHVAAGARRRSPDARVVHLASGRRNSFDLLRLGAATLVLFSHSFVLAAASEPQIGGASFGFFGVEVFFAISGFLVVKSWDKGPQLRDFFAKRALRILPALAVCVIVSAYGLGLVLSTLSPADYLTSSRPFGYVAQNLVAIASGGVLSPAYELPGVFASNPHDASINGSLWTLPIEVQAYFMVALLGSLSLTRRALPVIAGCALLVLAAPAKAYGMPLVGDVLQNRPEAVQLLAIFGVAGLLYLHRERLPLRLDAAAFALATFLLALGTPAEKFVTTLALPYVVLVAAYRLPAGAQRLTRHGDVSYGLYLLAFPVQQSILLAFPALTPVPLFLMSLPITYGLAFASWRLIERPALRLKPPPRNVGAVSR